MAALIVDDDPDNLAMWQLVFRRVGCDCEQAEDGRSALEAAARLGPAGLTLAFVDLYLPDMSGLALIDRLRRIAPGALLVTATALDDEATVRASFESGADVFLVKPCMPVMLRQILALAPGQAASGKHWIADRLGIDEYCGSV